MGDALRGQVAKLWRQPAEGLRAGGEHDPPRRDRLAVCKRGDEALLAALERGHGSPLDLDTRALDEPVAVVDEGVEAHRRLERRPALGVERFEREGASGVGEARGPRGRAQTHSLRHRRPGAHRLAEHPVLDGGLVQVCRNRHTERPGSDHERVGRALLELRDPRLLARRSSRLSTRTAGREST